VVPPVELADADAVGLAVVPSGSTPQANVPLTEPDEPQGQPGGVVTIEDVYRFDALTCDDGRMLPVTDPFAPGDPEPGWPGTCRCSYASVPSIRRALPTWPHGKPRSSLRE